MMHLLLPKEYFMYLKPKSQIFGVKKNDNPKSSPRLKVHNVLWGHIAGNIYNEIL